MKLKQLGIGCVMIGGLTLPSAARAEKPALGGGSVDGQFQMMDTNADGKLSPDEHAAGAKKMFDMMDANKDGKVTAAEMTEAHQRVTGQKTEKAENAERTEKTEMSAAEKIKVIDTNGDGTLTAEEHAAGAKKMFAMMDVNHDGFLSKAELMAGHARMMHKAGKPE